MFTQEYLTDLIRDLVQIETENPPGNEKECAEFIVDWFSDQDIPASLVYEPYPDRPQAVAEVGTGDPTIVLNGHIDVVPAGDHAEWTYPPYQAKIENERMYGRGCADMKGGVAVGMLATATLAQQIQSGNIEGSVIMHAAIGEETAEPGTLSLLENGYDGTFGVVLEPTSLRTATSEKGLAWYEISVRGEPSHASRPDQGINAIQHAMPLLEALTSYDTEVRAQTDELVGSAYATVTEFNAGTKENVVPERATLTVDRRFLPNESVSQIDTEISDLLQTVEEQHGIETTWERTRTYESAAINTNSPVAEVFRDESHRIAEIDPEPWGIKASTDVRNFVNDCNMEAITWGPGDTSEAHTYDESLDIPEAYVGYEILCSTAERLLS